MMLRTLLIAAAVSLPTAARAQWTVVNLHPAGALHSHGYGADGTQQVGVAFFTSFGANKALLWNGSANDWVDLTPSGAIQAYVASISGGTEAGWFGIGNGDEHAALWSGSAESVVDLNPIGASTSQVQGCDSEQQVGLAVMGGTQHASLWSGSAQSWIDLSPPGATFSGGLGVDHATQVGFATINGIVRAALWHGSAASRVDLHPPTTEDSWAQCIHSGQQAGRAVVNGVSHAAVWSGSADSWVDLNPSGAFSSNIFGAYQGQQVGSAMFSTDHAGMWSGTPESWFDLHTLLPSSFSSSVALSVSRSGSSLYVVGHGFNTATNRTEALLWIGPACDTVWIQTQPDDAALVPGATASFQVQVVGTATAYQWRRDGVALADGGRLSGVDSATLAVDSVQPSDQGRYDCVVTGPCNVVNSGRASLSCAPVLLSQPPHREFLVAGLQLSVAVPANAAYSYHWRLNDQNLFNIPGMLSGVTTRTLSILSDDPSLEGIYDVFVTDSCGEVVSDYADVRRCFQDFNDDGNVGTDADIQSFFECLAGSCCPACGTADYNHDGDLGTDQDIESFFRVLAGGPC